MTNPSASGDNRIYELARMLDQNNNNVIDDAEILIALTLWIKEEAIPGTDRFISDDEILALQELWIKGETIPDE